MKRQKVKAIGLLSGGLDSILAVKVVQQQGIEVVGLSFVTPFFGSKLAEKAANDLSISLIIKDITNEHFKVVKNPLHGFGKTMNPCIDCHALMFKIAGQIMRKRNFDFIFSGEVLDERPMSQNRRSLDIVAKISGFKNQIIRPLSAKLLEKSVPEKKGVIDREKLLNICGRGRKRQIELARKFKVKEYPNPAGGCLLTDKGFSQRLKDLLNSKQKFSDKDLHLLKLGRHYRFSDAAKLIVGRDKGENDLIEAVFDQTKDYLLLVENIPGPMCLLRGDKLSKHVQSAAEICTAYSDTQENIQYRVIVRNKNKERVLKITCNKAKKGEKRINLMINK
ncbi:MAG: tRNA 4-thiouridine(8) synthase ThiI [Candidatus Omnitrophota bacterium]